MKITFTITTNIGSLTHYFKDNNLVSGFQSIEDMVNEKADPMPRTVMLNNFLKKSGLWHKNYENFFVTNIERTEEGEQWLYTKTLNK